MMQTPSTPSSIAPPVSSGSTWLAPGQQQRDEDVAGGLGRLRRRGDRRGEDRRARQRSAPSRAFSATLPVKPSVTMTSASPVSRSRPSTLPTKRTPGARGEQRVGLLDEGVPLGLLLADREQRDAGSADAVARRTYAAPICANCTQPSRRGTRRSPRRRCRIVGWSPEIGQRRRDRRADRRRVIRPIRSRALAIVAPVLPALTIAKARPSRTASAARTSEESFFVRTRLAGSSSIAMTSLAGRISSSPVSPRLPSSGPTRSTGMPSSSAHRRAPATISPGALSPPIASTATGSTGSASSAPGSVDLDRLAALVPAAVRTDDVGQLRVAALRDSDSAPARRASRPRRGGCGSSPSRSSSSGRPSVVILGSPGGRRPSAHRRGRRRAARPGVQRSSGRGSTSRARGCG